METHERTVVADVMTTPLETIEPDTDLVDAAKAMRAKEIGALLVTTAPPSIVTSTDVLDAVARERDTSRLNVADVMTESIETVPPSLSLNETAAMMETFRIDHLPVVEDDYVGMISSTDVTAHLSGERSL
ncbi:CBS domain-containing protein [Haloarcula nitratireducens]|uniref:CBS domain-containing protein n=1 Tax=Haloarcula nitratireducens TaxID=2487749 RepID=A0AAW4PJA0_9EURY|nr:CBS domain-containing protein [Halomicroarcula nitratireducens]MBX0297718.1 CBS domain-containing protein [Halomicroarcula nitratireducens]